MAQGSLGGIMGRNRQKKFTKTGKKFQKNGGVQMVEKLIMLKHFTGVIINKGEFT